MSVPRFATGQRVRIADRAPGVHHRVPAYAKGRIGRIERICGLHGQPERFIRGNGAPARRLYRVRLHQDDLWSPYEGQAHDVLDIEVFEHWLEPVE